MARRLPQVTVQTLFGLTAHQFPILPDVARRALPAASTGCYIQPGWCHMLRPGSRLDTYVACAIAGKADNEKAKGPDRHQSALRPGMPPNVCLFFNLSHF
jgi:hypothetical protein